MALIDRVKERTGSDLSDTELQAMIDAIVAEIEARFGPAGPITVSVGDPTDYQEGRFRHTIRLTRPADTEEPMTVVEIEPGNTGAAAGRAELSADDYRVLHGGRTLQRLQDGPHGRCFWAPLVEITYTPKGAQSIRDEAVIRLMQLDLSWRGGLKSERAGDYSFTLSDRQAEDREAIFSWLAGVLGAGPMTMA